MKQIVKILMCIACLLYAVTAAAEGQFSPTWNEGQQWRVKAVYPSLSPEKPGDSWSEPVIWFYRVVEKKLYQGEECFFIEVRDLEGGLGIGLLMIYRARDFLLLNTQMIRQVRQRRMETSLDYEGSVPVRTTGSIIPFDTPAFPLVYPSDRYFKTTRRVSHELKAQEIIRQQVELIKPGKDLPIEIKTDQLIKVECTRQGGQSWFVQYWDARYPWPVFGYNNSIKYWLVSE